MTNEARPYVHTLQAQAAPTALVAMARFQGVRCEGAQKAKRYLDLGCGTGFSLCLLAATNPGIDFVGVDLLPDHIEAGRKIAREAGLENVTFIEAGFAELKAEPERIGMADFISAHGILSWVDGATRGDVFDLVGEILSPGGLVYLGYNAFPGWAAIEPLRHTIWSFAKGKTGPDADTAIRRAFALFQRLRADKVGVMADNPALEQWLDDNADQPPAYLWHEYVATRSSAFWRDEMADMLAPQGLTFIGSARLAENIDALNFNSGLMGIVKSASEAGHGQLVRDLAGNRYFATDVFARAPRYLDTDEALRHADDAVLVALCPWRDAWPDTAREPGSDAIMECLGAGPLRLGDLGAATGRPMAEMRARALSLASSGLVGFARHGYETIDPAIAERFNRSVSGLTGCPGMAIPVIGGGKPFHRWIQDIMSGTDRVKRDWLSQLAPGCI